MSQNSQFHTTFQSFIFRIFKGPTEMSTFMIKWFCLSCNTQSLRKSDKSQTRKKGRLDLHQSFNSLGHILVWTTKTRPNKSMCKRMKYNKYIILDTMTLQFQNQTVTKYRIETRELTLMMISKKVQTDCMLPSVGQVLQRKALKL